MSKKVVHADTKTAKELDKARSGYKPETVVLTDGSETSIDKQNGDGETAFYRLAGGGNRWITCDSVKKRL